jgi:hypothetical protein
MPKARYAERNANRNVKKRKLTGVIGGHRLAKLKSKRVKAGTYGTVSEYVGRTKAIKRLQLSIADFRRLCILKGIYPRDPKNKKHLDSKQTYYHHKDIMFLAHEPLLRKFNEQLVSSWGVLLWLARAPHPRGGRWGVWGLVVGWKCPALSSTHPTSLPPSRGQWHAHTRTHTHTLHTLTPQHTRPPNRPSPASSSVP